MSTEPGRGVAKGVGAYEFFTEAGVHVSLHHTSLAGVSWLPDTTLRFWFTFLPGWVPSGAEATPVVELEFARARVALWETDDDGLPFPERHGQVTDFTWDGGDGFDLAAFTVHLSFSAARMTVRLPEAVPAGIG